MPETQPRDTRPAQTVDGDPIVYIQEVEAGIKIEFPLLGINFELPKSCYKAESVKHSLETIAGAKISRSQVEVSVSLVFVGDCLSSAQNGR